jgi:hypothetical protein
MDSRLRGNDKRERGNDTKALLYKKNLYQNSTLAQFMLYVFLNH